MFFILASLFRPLDFVDLSREREERMQREHQTVGFESKGFRPGNRLFIEPFGGFRNQKVKVRAEAPFRELHWRNDGQEIGHVPAMLRICTLLRSAREL
jgi:hypothetical protein